MSFFSVGALNISALISCPAVTFPEFISLIMVAPSASAAAVKTLFSLNVSLLVCHESILLLDLKGK